MNDILRQLSIRNKFKFRKIEATEMAFDDEPALSEFLNLNLEGFADIYKASFWNAAIQIFQCSLFLIISRQNSAAFFNYFEAKLCCI